MTKDQLDGFKKALLEKKAEIEKEVLQFSTPSASGDENLPSYEEIGKEFGDDASERESFQRNAVVLRQLEEHLRSVDAAIERIEQGVYGVSVFSGKEIPMKRLEVYPEAKGLADEEE